MAFAIRRAFSDAADGVYPPEQLRDLLNDYAAGESVEAKMVEFVETKAFQYNAVSIYVAMIDSLDASQQVPLVSAEIQVWPMLSTAVSHQLMTFFRDALIAVQIPRRKWRLSLKHPVEREPP